MEQTEKHAPRNGKRLQPVGMTGNLLKGARFAADFKTAEALAKAAGLEPNVVATLEAFRETEMRSTKKTMSKIIAALDERGVRLEMDPTSERAFITKVKKEAAAPKPADAEGDDGFPVNCYPMTEYDKREFSNPSWCFIHGWNQSKREAFIQGGIDAPKLSLSRTIQFWNFYLHYKRRTLFVPMMYANDHRTGTMDIIYVDMAGNILRRNAVEWVRHIHDEETGYKGVPYINTGQAAAVSQLQEAFFGVIANALAYPRLKSEIIAMTVETALPAPKVEKKDA